MNEISIDLTNCDKEPIHILGKIQNRGFLIAISAASLRIIHISENIHSYIAVHADDLLDKHLSTLSGFFDGESDHFISMVTKAANDLHEDGIDAIKYSIGGKLFHFILSHSEDELILEFEEVLNNSYTTEHVYTSVSTILASDSIETVMNSAVHEIKALIGYDRVMIYKFMTNGSGEVVAEAKENHLGKFYGLRYPESDIPKQARELYKKNTMRLISDVNMADVPILSLPGSDPVNLTYAVLRAVSPTHIQYLKNMKVASSYSISILINGELWGLISCHNYTPKAIDYRVRLSAGLLTKVITTALDIKLKELNRLNARKFEDALLVLHNHLLNDSSIIDALITHKTNLLHVTDATGVSLFYNKHLYTLGKTPGENNIHTIISWASTHMEGDIYYHHEFSKDCPDAFPFLQDCAGVLIVILNKENRDMILWFKPEQVYQIQWAGQPKKHVIENGSAIDGYKILPRDDFNVWVEQIKQTSNDWSQEEVDAVSRMKEMISEAIQKRQHDEDNFDQRLKEAYDELNAFSYTVSHDLKTPLTVMRTYAQLLQLSSVNTDAKNKQIISKIIDSADRMTLMMDDLLDFSRINKRNLQITKIDASEIINTVSKENQLAHNYYNTQIEIGETPTVMGDPVLVYHVFANIIGNAFKYSSKSKIPVIAINGVEDKENVTYEIKDNGIGIDENKKEYVFDLFKRMDNAQDYKGSGVGLTIVKKIMDKHNGKIWFTSKLNEGATFYILFKKRPYSENN